MLYRDEAHEHEAIMRDHEYDLDKIDGFTDIEQLREYAKWLAKERRATRENLADWRWGRLRRPAFRIAPGETP